LVGQSSFRDSKKDDTGCGVAVASDVARDVAVLFNCPMTLIRLEKVQIRIPKCSQPPTHRYLFIQKLAFPSFLFMFSISLSDLLRT
jgi:hypothetical protein